MLHLYLSGEVTVNGAIHGNHDKSQLFNSFSFKIWHLMTHMLLRKLLSKHMTLTLFLLIWMFKRCSSPSISQPAIWFHILVSRQYTFGPCGSLSLFLSVSVLCLSLFLLCVCLLFLSVYDSLLWWITVLFSPLHFLIHMWLGFWLDRMVLLNWDVVFIMGINRLGGGSSCEVGCNHQSSNNAIVAFWNTWVQ